LSHRPRKRLTSCDPVEGTPLWQCRTPDCVDANGKPSEWPLRVITSLDPYQTSQTASCERCGVCRPATTYERALVEGDPNANPPIVGTIGLIRQHAANIAAQTHVPFDVVDSLAFAVACEAALTFDQANGFKFTTYLKSRLRFDCSTEKAIREHRIQPNGEGQAATTERVDESTLIAQVDGATKAGETLLELLDNAGVDDKSRELLLLRFGHNMGLAELSERFQLPQSTLGIRIHNLLLRIRGSEGSGGSGGKVKLPPNSQRAPHPKPLPMTLFDDVESEEQIRHDSEAA